MTSKICPKCHRIMSYDPYFKANICRQCGATEKVSTTSYMSKKIIATKFDSSKSIMLTK